MSTLQIQPQFSALEQWKALAAQQGFSFELLELSLPGALKDASVINAYRQTGLVRSLHGAFVDVNPASGEPAIRRLSRQLCEESCTLAVSLGASNVVFHCSCFPFLRGGYLSQWADSCAEFYRELTVRYPLTVLIENSMDLDPEPLTALMKAVGSPNVGVCLDIGHANDSRAPIEQWFEALQGHIRYLHLSDNYGSFDDHLPLGTGTVNWNTVDLLARQAGTVDDITLEVGSLDAVKASTDYLKEHHLFGMG